MPSRLDISVNELPHSRINQRIYVLVIIPSTLLANGYQSTRYHIQLQHKIMGLPSTWIGIEGLLEHNRSTKLKIRISSVSNLWRWLIAGRKYCPQSKIKANKQKELNYTNYTPTRMTTILKKKTQTWNKCCWGCEKSDSLCTFGGNVK